MLRVQSQHTDAHMKVYISVVFGSPLAESVRDIGAPTVAPHGDC